MMTNISLTASVAPVVAESERTASPRNISIDRFRGLMVFLMVGGNFLLGVDWVPAFIKHTPDIGFTVADAVAPCFVIAIALTYGDSFHRRYRHGQSAAYGHFAERYCALIGIGAILSAGGTAVAGQPSAWGVLQALGMAGLICLLFIRFGTLVRTVVGLAILLGYQFGLAHGLLPAVLGNVQGGFFGALAWGSMLILATVLVDLRHQGWQAALAGLALAAICATFSSTVVPLSKVRVSLSYVLLTLTIGWAVYLLIDWISLVKLHPSGFSGDDGRARTQNGRGEGEPRVGFLCWWGENPLALYLCHLLLLALVVLPGVPTWYSKAPVWLTLTQLAVLMLALTGIAYLLHSRRVLVKL